RHAFARRKLRRVVVRRVGGRTVKRLALAVAHADDLGRVRLCEQVLDGKQTAETVTGIADIRAARQDDVRIRRRGAGIFGIENGFAVVPVHAGVRAGRRTRGMNLGEGGVCIAVELHDAAEDVPVGRLVDVGVFNHDDRLARARNARLEGRV